MIFLLFSKQLVDGCSRKSTVIPKQIASLTQMLFHVSLDQNVLRDQSNGTSKVSGLYYLAGASQISWPQLWVCNLSILKEGKIEVLGLPVSKVYFNYNALMVEMLMFNIWSRIGFRPWGKWKIFSSTHVVNIFLITDLWWLARSQGTHLQKFIFYPSSVSQFVLEFSQKQGL